MTMTATNRSMPLTRAAMRFLLRHRAGVIEGLDPTTGRSMRGRVHYEPREGGAFTAFMPADRALVDVITSGGAVSITVDASHAPARGPVRDEVGLPTEHAVASVTALVDARLLELRESHIGEHSDAIAMVELHVNDLETVLRSVSINPAA